MNSLRLAKMNWQLEKKMRIALQTKLAVALDALRLIDVGERDSIAAPEDHLIKDLCERIGYGAVMVSAARQWRKKDPIGAFTCGPCVHTVKQAIEKIQK